MGHGTYRTLHVGQLKWTPTRKKERKRMPGGERNDQIFAEALEKKNKKKIKGLHKRQVITRRSFLKQKKKKVQSFHFFTELPINHTSVSKEEGSQGRERKREGS